MLPLQIQKTTRRLASELALVWFEMFKKNGLLRTLRPTQSVSVALSMPLEGQCENTLRIKDGCKRRIKLGNIDAGANGGYVDNKRLLTALDFRRKVLHDDTFVVWKTILGRVCEST